MMMMMMMYFQQPSRRHSRHRRPRWHIRFTDAATGDVAHYEVAFCSGVLSFLLLISQQFQWPLVTINNTNNSRNILYDDVCDSEVSKEVVSTIAVGRLISCVNRAINVFLSRINRTFFNV